MSGICGWVGSFAGDASTVMAAMLGRDTWLGAGASAALSGRRFSVGAAGPASTWHVTEDGAVKLAWQGHPVWDEWGERRRAPDEFSRQTLRAYRDAGPAVLERIHGDFVIVLIDTAAEHAVFAVDRIGIRNLAYAVVGDTLVFGPTCDVVAAFPGVSRNVDPQGIYNYVYFHMVPGPATIFQGLRRLEAGHQLVFERGRPTSKPYWQMRFVENVAGDFDTLAAEFRRVLGKGVAAFGTEGSCGTFLSGGTDSSTVSGLLGEISGVPAKTFSIGFEAQGYDEMDYARLAARHFKTEQHEYYVTPADVVDAVPAVAQAYDQPFGNASAVPTYFCAKLGRAHGVARMLGGDGGDELFGGNARYARQHQLALYERLPAALRKAIIEPALFGLPGVDAVPILRKGRNYVAQARLPMPARYESYNLLERLGPENVFAPDFLAGIDRTAPLTLMESTYGASNASSLVNRMLALDLKFTLADNDLLKVTRMCELAGVDVAFPMLHDEVVAFSANLAPDLKLRGTKLRYFFKEALRGFLPDEILAKEKHGFGLPAGVWMRDYAPLGALASDAIAGLRARRVFRAELLDSLLGARLRAHAGYYGTMAWILMILELWFRKHAASG